MTRIAERREETEVEAKAPARTRDEGIAPAAEALRRVAEPAELASEVASDWKVSTDAHAESEADTIADAAVQRFEGPAVANGGLAPGMQSAMTQAAPGLSGLDKVRFDQSATASVAADSIGALAFTQGNDVSVASGELTPHLAAHEAVHAVAHDDGMVHPKLRGTSDALKSMAGGESTSGLRKKIGAKTNWDKILDGVAAYEALEAALLAGGKNPSLDVIAQSKPKMLKLLNKVQSDVKAWQKSNDQEGQDKKAAEYTKKLKENTGNTEADDRTKAERRQAIAMLIPRLGNEIGALSSKDSKAWIESLGLSAPQITAKGKEQSGQINTVAELEYQTESGPFAGYFKADQGFAKKMQGHEADVGIQQADPNYGARSVAMYKLDKLLGAGVTARAEFASHVDTSGKTVLGTVLESAKGTKAGETKIAFSKEQAKQIGPGAIVLDDPVFQQSLNKLQVLDAICGQLDRHVGNYYIQSDESGKVTGVTGIDLDMAFGRDQQSDKEGKSAPNFKGLPAQIDQEFGRRLLQIAPGDIEACLTGLLPAGEIQATMGRFMTIRSKVQEMNTAGKLTVNWDAQAAMVGLPPVDSIQRQTQRTSYQADMTQEALFTTGLEVLEAVKSALGAGFAPRPFQASLRRNIGDLPETTRNLLVLGAAGTDIAGAIPIVVREYIYKTRNGDIARDLGLLMVNELLRDSSLLAKISVKVQEDPKTSSLQIQSMVLEAARGSYLEAALAKVKQPPKKEEPQPGGGRKSMIGSRR